MNWMKKATTLALVAAMTLSSLAGCSSNAKSETAGASSSTPKGENKAGAATITVWEHTPQMEEPLKLLIEGFNAKNPDIKVEYEVKTADQYYNLLATTMQAGEAPDLFWTNGTATSNYPKYVEQGLVMDLTDKLDLSAFSPAAMQLVEIDGKVYSTPGATADVKVVYFNQDIFDELKLEIPTSFEEFEKMLPVIKEAGYIPMSLGGKFFWSVLFQFEPMTAALASDWLDEAAQGKAKPEDPRLIAVLEKMKEWGEKGYYGDGYMGVDEGGQLLAFSKGESAMTVTGSWNLETFRKNNPDLNLGAFAMPDTQGKRPIVVTPSAGFCISADTQYPEESLLFAEYFSSLEGQQIWVNALSGVPNLDGVISEDPVVAQMQQSDYQVASFYNILGDFAAEGQNPRQAFEEDAIKFMAGSITAEELAQTLTSMMQ